MAQWLQALGLQEAKNLVEVKHVWYSWASPKIIEPRAAFRN